MWVGDGFNGIFKQKSVKGLSRIAWHTKGLSGPVFHHLHLAHAGLGIARAVSLTGTSRIFDKAGAGQAARMPVKTYSSWLSVF